MVYVALLRGINVGGNNKVDMKQLKASFEDAGMRAVKTYINSGNVIFVGDETDPTTLTEILETIIEKTFGFRVKVLLRSIDDIRAVADRLPETWQNNADMKCDVLFLWEQYDSPSVLQQLTIKPDLEDVEYVAGAILWRVDRQNVTRSGLIKLVGTDLYKHMTIRNCNTVRKLLLLMEATT